MSRALRKNNFNLCHNFSQQVYRAETMIKIRIRKDVIHFSFANLLAIYSNTPAGLLFLCCSI